MPDPLSGHGCILYLIAVVMGFYGVFYAAFYLISLFE